jgi:hypothetical protein
MGRNKTKDIGIEKFPTKIPMRWITITNTRAASTP